MTEIKPDQRIDRRTLQVHLSVTGAEPIKLLWGDASIVPRLLAITYTLTEGRRSRSIEVSGGRVKKDGTAGQVVSSFHLTRYDDTWYDQAPEWVRQAADAHAPDWWTAP